MHDFFIELTEAHAVTRYPEEIKRLQKEFNLSLVLEIIQKSKKAIEWIKDQFLK